MTANPFRQKLFRNRVRLKTAVWQADAGGKDNSAGKTDLSIGEDYLWIAYDFSIPLKWILGVEPMGPGFRVAWSNPLSGVSEQATFCCRTMLGYDLGKRDRLLTQIREAVAASAARPLPGAVKAAQQTPMCERCGFTPAHVYDLTWMFSVFAIWLSKPTRSILCAGHARARLLLVTASNLLLGNLGLGAVISPIISLANIREVRSQGSIGGRLAAAMIAISFLPYALLLGLVTWSIHYAITF